MLGQRSVVLLRGGLLCSLHHSNCLPLKPLLRSISNVHLTCHHKKLCKQPTLHTTTLPGGILPNIPLGAGVGWHSCRAASTEAGSGGWYQSVADSAPVHFTEQFLLSVHETTGLPWWATIVGSTMALRAVITLPLGAYQMTIIGKVEALQAEIAELAKRLHYEVSVRAKQRAWTERDCRYQFKKNLRRIVSELYIRDNCHPFKASVVVWVQLPMWVCLSLALRSLSLGLGDTASALHTELAAGGALWFSDLTIPDSTWIMPISLGLVNLIIVEIFALRKLEISRFQKYVTNFIRGISLLMIPIAATVPSSMALYWLSSSCFGLGQNLLLRSPGFRRMCRIPASRLDSDTPYRDIGAAFVAKYFK
ncbi:cytochrome c oxidase assembly protein COX18, mitochondrial [Aplochiton taeniatus]